MNNAEEILISYKLETNKVYIKSKKDNNFNISIENWNSTIGNCELLYSTNLDVLAGVEVWLSPLKRLEECEGFKVTVKKGNAVLKENFVKNKSKLYGKIKKQVIAIKITRGMGDIMNATPAIKKISEAFNQKIVLITTIPDIFINNPYIEEIIHATEANLNDLIQGFRTGENAQKYKVHEVYNLREGMNFSILDLKQFCAFDLGFSLKLNEADLCFYPNDYEKINDLPENYICINPSVTSLYRSWGQENWQKFINLIENHIPVVAIGKGTNFDPETYKNFYKININNGLNLVNHPCQNTLSQAYHIISKSKTFVTMNNGLYCLALSTYNHITELATPLDSYFLRIRKGIPNYNLNYLEGPCNQSCNASLKYSAHFTGSNEVLKQGDCFLGISPESKNGFTDYKCFPAPEKVYESVLNHLKTNKYIV